MNYYRLSLSLTLTPEMTESRQPQREQYNVHLLYIYSLFHLSLVIIRAPTTLSTETGFKLKTGIERDIKLPSVPKTSVIPQHPVTKDE